MCLTFFSCSSVHIQQSYLLLGVHWHCWLCAGVLVVFSDILTTARFARLCICKFYQTRYPSVLSLCTEEWCKRFLEVFSKVSVVQQIVLLGAFCLKEDIKASFLRNTAFSSCTTISQKPVVGLSKVNWKYGSKMIVGGGRGEWKGVIAALVGSPAFYSG